MRHVYVHVVCTYDYCVVHNCCVCGPLHFAFIFFRFTCSSGALSADDLEADYGTDVDFLIAKLKIAANNQSVSYFKTFLFFHCSVTYNF